MTKLGKMFNDARKELEVLEDLRGLKAFFKTHDGKMFSKRITDKLPDNISITLDQAYDGPRLEVRIYWQNHFSYSNSFGFTISHTGYGKDLEIHPLDDKKRINSENIDTIIDFIIDYKKNYLHGILATDLDALSKALHDLYEAENAMKVFNYTLLSDGLEFWPDSYKTMKAIRNLNEYLTGNWTLEG